MIKKIRQHSENRCLVTGVLPDLSSCKHLELLKNPIGRGFSSPQFFIFCFERLDDLVTELRVRTAIEEISHERTLSSTSLDETCSVLRKSVDIYLVLRDLAQVWLFWSWLARDGLQYYFEVFKTEIEEVP